MPLFNFRCLTLLFSLVWLSQWPVYAQYDTGFKVALPAVDTPDPLANRLFYIDSVETTFPDTAAIGVVYRSMIGTMDAAYLKNGTSKALTRTLFALYPQFQLQQRPVRLRVHELRYTEDAAKGVELTAELTFLQSDSSGSYKPFYRASLQTEFMGMFDRGGRIKRELQRAIVAMNTWLNNPLVPPYLSDYERKLAQAVVDMRLDSAQYTPTLTAEDSILTCRQLRAGIYLSPTELTRNRPALTGQLFVDEREKFALLKRPDQRRTDKYRFTGFCTGEFIYVNSGLYGGTFAWGIYRKVLNVGHYLLWRDNYPSESERSFRSVSMSGGLLGGLLAAAATNYRDCIGIDTRTGELLHIDREKLVKILGDVPTLLYEYEAAGNSRKSDVIYAYMVRYNKAVSGQ